MNKKSKFNEKDYYNNKEKIDIFKKVLLILQFEVIIVLIICIYVFKNKAEEEKMFKFMENYILYYFLIYLCFKLFSSIKFILRIKILNWVIYLINNLFYLFGVIVFSFKIQIEFFIITFSYILISLHFLLISLNFNKNIIIPQVSLIFTNISIAIMTVFIYYLFGNNLKYLLGGLVISVILNLLILNNIMNYITIEEEKISIWNEEINNQKKLKKEEINDVKVMDEKDWDYKKKLYKFLKHKNKSNFIDKSLICWLCTNIYFENLKIEKYIKIILGWNKDFN